MRRISSRIAILLILTLLAQPAPSFAQEPRAYATVVVPTPSQFVEPPAFTRHSLKITAIGAGIFAAAVSIFLMIVGPID